MWCLGDSHEDGGVLESHYNIDTLDPSLVNVVQWDDREPGEGPGDAYYRELRRRR